MFHGPLFHSIAGVRAWDEGGLDATLADTPLDGFFEPGVTPALLINPVLLDAIGHVTAFGSPSASAPISAHSRLSIHRIDLYQAAREDTAGSVLAGRLGFESGEEGHRFLTGDFTCTDTEGRLLFRATGWRDRFFDVPHRFYFARWMPRDGFYGDDATALFATLPSATLVWRVPAFPPGFLDDAGGIWRRVLAHTVLSVEERAEWEALPRPMASRRVADRPHRAQGSCARLDRTSARHQADAGGPRPAHR